MRLVILLVSLVLLAPALPAASPPDPEARAEALRKINLAGRQRMLSQRIAMAVCLVRAGAEPGLNGDKAAAAEALFTRTLAGLRAGDAELGLPEESLPGVLSALDAVDGLWPRYRRSVAKVRDGAPGTATGMTTLRAQAGQLLKLTNAVVTRLETAHGAGLVAPELAVAVNVAGRQRMLIQKAMMQACFAVASDHGVALRRKVTATKSLFEHSLANLLIGNAEEGIPPPPTPEIDARLVRVVRMWRWLGADFDALAEGAPVDAARLAQLARAAEVTLVTMNEVVSLYEAL